MVAVYRSNLIKYDLESFKKNFNYIYCKCLSSDIALLDLHKKQGQKDFSRIKAYGKFLETISYENFNKYLQV